MASHSRKFLLNITPPYFDAFYFIDNPQPSIYRHAAHVFFKLVFFLEGDVYYDVGGKRHDLSRGDILFLPRYTSYTAYSPEQKAYRRVVIWFTGELLDSIDPSGTLGAFFAKFDTESGFRFRFNKQDRNRMVDLSVRLAGELEYAKPFSDLVSYSLMTNLLISIYRNAAFFESDPTAEPETSRLVEEVVAYINSHLSEDMSLDHIADMFYISKFHLERLFRKQMSTTVHNYVVQRRLTLARQKLYNGANPTKIYRSCGFSNYTTFYRAFRNMYNTTPKQFSQQAKALMLLDDSDVRLARAGDWTYRTQGPDCVD